MQQAYVQYCMPNRPLYVVLCQDCALHLLQFCYWSFVLSVVVFKVIALLTLLSCIRTCISFAVLQV